jgi:hypothetical protein
MWKCAKHAFILEVIHYLQFLTDLKLRQYVSVLCKFGYVSRLRRLLEDVKWMLITILKNINSSNIIAE